MSPGGLTPPPLYGLPSSCFLGFSTRGLYVSGV